MNFKFWPNLFKREIEVNIKKVQNIVLKIVNKISEVEINFKKVYEKELRSFGENPEKLNLSAQG